jgi:hypothetical protein
MTPRLARAASSGGIARQSSPSTDSIETILRGPLGHVDVLLHIHGLVAEGLLSRPHLIDATESDLTIDPGDERQIGELVCQALQRPVGPIAVLVHHPAVERSVEAIRRRFPGLPIRTFPDEAEAAAWLEREAASRPA